MKNRILYLSSMIASCVFLLCNSADAQFRNMPVQGCPMRNMPAQNQYQYQDGYNNWDYRYQDNYNRYMPNNPNNDNGNNWWNWERNGNRNGNDGNGYHNPGMNGNGNHDNENWWRQNRDENGNWWNRDQNGDRDVKGAWMNRNGNGNGYQTKPLKMDSVEKFSGVVKSVNRVQYPDGTHLQVVLQTDQGDLTVMLGPANFVEQSKVRVVSGDKVQVFGYRVGANGSEVIVAQKISKNGNELQLRNNGRQPMWRQRQLNGNMQGPHKMNGMNGMQHSY